MIYAMSDLHGCFDKYLTMLDKIKFSPEDTLYILGDVVDRGPDGIKILLDMVSRNNIVFIRGNHDQTTLKVLRKPADINNSFNDYESSLLLKSWVNDGGNTTIKQFTALTDKEKSRVIDYIQNSKIFVELTVNNKNYFLAHSFPEYDLMTGAWKDDINNFLWGEPDYEITYFPDKYIVTGHTPTGFIDDKYRDKIYIKNNHIAIDCGAVFAGGRLGCVCLNTMEEFYV